MVKVIYLYLVNNISKEFIVNKKIVILKHGTEVKISTIVLHIMYNIVVIEINQKEKEKTKNRLIPIIYYLYRGRYDKRKSDSPSRCTYKIECKLLKIWIKIHNSKITVLK